MTKHYRPDWDCYFLGVAKAVSQRADCRRHKFGSIIVRDNRIISTGYNGSYPGGPSCLNGECPRGLSNVPSYLDGNNDYSDCISQHSESNCIAFAHRDLRGSTIYTYDNKPCDSCSKTIRAHGIIRVVWGQQTPVNESGWEIYDVAYSS